MDKADQIVINYNDAILRRSDLDILKGPHFLNDRIIEFYFSYLVSTYLTDANILLVPPSISFWITNCPSSNYLEDVLGPLQFQKRKMIIFAVNDNADVTLAEGGSHWSLLAYQRDKNVFEHYDSMGGLNSAYAIKLFRRVKGFMALTSTMYVERLTPSQKNGYDCGLYVLVIAQELCSSFVTDDDFEERSLEERIMCLEVSKFRGKILTIVEGLIDKN